MESIQLAQMLADLNSLKAAEPDRAAALVNANTKTPAPDPSSKPSSSSTDHHHPAQPHLPGSAATTPCSASPFVSRTASPAKFDKFGRRILTPPNTRTSSAYASLPGTPRNEFEDDVDRAHALMALYEIRAKLKDQDSRSLNKLREKIAALHAKQQAERGHFGFGKQS
ncbi:uncharacterized protein CTHT_0056670 [Thermochaetoides thermophila DSM 1495]|uniref:Uncharacterized protein n=1 Tax=Chaetomium thermophilum (strain DSM 1495 / CBS 144.50 / IMI 039719) TaxID=759272 RepID=G0SCB9_CHATD|nr:hypothetical protein CTHT_0056670 [Thermochaetoides thermophila DSM 1495]EGS19045.1 hypothetical protein CTHT_0056670 [Thermochaetoides thermophila DSM 1495]